MSPRRSFRLTSTFKEFFANERAGAIVLILCTIVSLVLANTAFGPSYVKFFHSYLGPLSVEHWINDGLMAIFFLVIGLELEREIISGELSDLKKALLPIFAAIGGILVPAGIHFFFNNGTPSQSGVGIPMATDIAFAVGVLALIGNRVPASLKVFLVALAVIDDLGAIIVIAVFYTSELAVGYLIGAIGVALLLLAFNHFFRIMSLVPYLIGGTVMWYLMLKSGVHATIAGVLLAFTIPFSAKQDDADSPSHKLEHFLHKPVAFIILPIFALANTGLMIGSNWASELGSANSLGILIGLGFGKPLGIFLVSFIVVTVGLCRLPLDLNWKHIIGAGMLGGIGFTMSIFITNLAFPGQQEMIDSSKMAIFIASVFSGAIGLLWLNLFGQPNNDDDDPDTMDYDDE
ncbi:MAG TPA: Na+/H+ antiporter NhaA [Pyrinomonadaceae bacterium]|nr:Na+/H+ antiporter NhaA [Pyrinomonadaceae bacterium]